MNVKRNIVAVLVMLACCYFSIRGYDTKFFQTTKPVIKHSINFSLLLAVALSGYFAITSLGKTWIKNMWVLMYCALIIMLVCIGVVDLFLRINNYNVRDMIANIRMVFTSPLPFAILLFISYSSAADKQKESKTEYPN